MKRLLILTMVLGFVALGGKAAHAANLLANPDLDNVAVSSQIGATPVSWVAASTTQLHRHIQRRFVVRRLLERTPAGWRLWRLRLRYFLQVVPRRSCESKWQSAYTGQFGELQHFPRRRGHCGHKVHPDRLGRCWWWLRRLDAIRPLSRNSCCNSSTAPMPFSEARRLIWYRWAWEPRGFRIRSATTPTRFPALRRPVRSPCGRSLSKLNAYDNPDWRRSSVCRRLL